MRLCHRHVFEIQDFDFTGWENLCQNGFGLRAPPSTDRKVGGARCRIHRKVHNIDLGLFNTQHARQLGINVIDVHRDSVRFALSIPGVNRVDGRSERVGNKENTRRPECQRSSRLQGNRTCFEAKIILCNQRSAHAGIRNESERHEGKCSPECHEIDAP